MGFYNISITIPNEPVVIGMYIIPSGESFIILEGIETIISGIIVSGELIVDGRITIM